MKKISYRHNIFVILAIVIFTGLLTFLLWQKGAPTNIYLDMGFPVSYMLFGTSLWESLTTQQFSLLSQPMFLVDPYLTEIIPKIFMHLTGNLFASIKILLALQIALAMGTMYIAMRTQRISKIAALTAAGVYGSTPFLIQMLNGANALTWGYVTFPLAIALIIKTLEKPTWQRNILLGATIALTTFLTSIQFIYYHGIALIVIFIILAIAKLKEKSITTKQLLLTILTAGVIFTALITFYIIPTFTEQSPYARFTGETEYRKNPTVKNFYAPTYKEVLAQMNKEWLKSEEVGKSIENIPKIPLTSTLLLTTIGIIGIGLRNKKSKRILPAVLTVAAIINVALALPYFDSTIQIWLTNNLPGYYTIRTSGRFLIPIIMLFAMGTGFFIAHLQRYKKKITYISAGLILLTALLAGQYYGILFKTFTTTPIEDRYPDEQQVRAILQKELKNDQKVLDYTLSTFNDSAHHLKWYSAGYPTLHSAYEPLWRAEQNPETLGAVLKDLNVKFILTNNDAITHEKILHTLSKREETLTKAIGIVKKHTTPHGITVWENTLLNNKEGVSVQYKDNYAGHLQLKELELAYSANINTTTATQPIKVIGDSDNAINEIVNTKALTSVSIKDSLTTKSATWETKSNLDLDHTIKLNTLFNNNTTLNTINNSRLINEEVLTTTESGSLQIKTPQEIQKKETYIIALHGYTDPETTLNIKTEATNQEPLQKQGNNNEAQWFTQEVKLTPNTPITISTEAPEKITVFDHIAILPKDSLPKTAPTLTTHTIIEQGDQRTLTENTTITFKNNGEWKEELWDEQNKDIYSKEAKWFIASPEQGFLTALDNAQRYQQPKTTLASPTTADTNRINIHSTTNTEHPLSITRKIATTISLLALAAVISALISLLWQKKQQS